ncbi:MAG: Ni/Fe-hydrogenase, b-type cytochrome subunit [Gemmatimonadota bacterium]|nr:Ni/Fe-hydrogenase, b-type cytochrome subunit [Gemmatimonadota bacterium]
MTPSSAGPAARPAPPLFGFGRAFTRERGHFTWVYLWGAPLRAMHWIAALCVVVLVVTGLYIGRPYFMTSGEASSHFLMGWVRFIHFTAAATIVMTGIVRVYWLFAGNQFERLRALAPISKGSLANIGKTAMAYLTFRPDKQPNFVGHNPLQQLSYTGVYLLMVVMVITGFTLYGQSNPDGLIFRAFAWVPPLLGGLQAVRLVHHALTWAFIIFILLHVYLAVRSDYVERAGVVSSIITGGRYVSMDERYEDIDVDRVPASPWPTSEYPVPTKQ